LADGVIGGGSAGKVLACLKLSAGDGLFRHVPGSDWDGMAAIVRLEGRLLAGDGLLSQSD